MIVAICFLLIFAFLYIAPGRIARSLKRKGKKHAKRIIKKQIKHEINRFKPF